MADTKPIFTIPQLHWMQRADLGIAGFFLCVIIMLVMPLPPVLIDLSIAINLTLAVMIILTVTYVVKATEFSVFPSLLLITTLFRLSIEVATCKLILLGQGEGIGIVKTFGTFVVGGNIVVGIIVFIILTVIQLLVIVRGTIRVSEVAARFTLDAMPGRQMAIDADLNAGYITEKEASEKRVEIRKEADFYGSMDGATKFVQGDVIAGIIITVINIVAGLGIGIGMRGESMGTAFANYTTYTVGAALAAQIPAFLISVSTGLLVSRTASDHNLGTDVVHQMTSSPKILWFATGILAFFMLTPVPKIPLFIMMCGMGALAYIMTGALKLSEQKAHEEKKQDERERLKKPESVAELLQMDQMELEVGYGLIPFIDPEQGGDLIDRVTIIRRQLALDLGIIVPPIRIRDNIQLRPNGYSIKIRGLEVGKGELKLDKFLAMGPQGSQVESLKGEETKEPIFGVTAYWIGTAEREKAEAAGYTVADSVSIVATHVTELIRKNACDLLGRQEVQTLVDTLKQNYPAVVNELIPALLSLGELQKVLHCLLIEGVSIRDLLTIFETLADWAPRTKDIIFLSEKVRQSLARHISKQYQSEDGILSVITIDPQLEEKIAASIKTGPEGEQLSLDPGILQKILVSVQEIVRSAAKQRPVILCSARTRRHVKTLMLRILPTIGVISYNEIGSDAQVRSVGTVNAN
ncbi:flagellar biosynthesis protein FlhA [bacterium]|nr:flagellar biosynthesis protein FlhA [bacterium]MBU1753912.1 flagellar biosynthesis protein FlhA [bacterium]